MAVTTTPKFCILTVLLVLASNSALHVSARHAILYTNESLPPGERLINGAYTLKMQVNCNLVLRDHGRTVWSTETAGKGSNCIAKMQDDGNLVIYDHSGQVAIWESNTVRGQDYYRLKLKSNRNLVILKGAAREVIWSTKTYVAEDVRP